MELAKYKKKELSKILKKDEFLIAYSPKSCLLKFSEFRTPERCIFSGTPALSEIKKDYGVEIQNDFLIIWIIDLTKKLNLKNAMSEDAMSEAALYIATDFYYLNIADLNLVFSNIKKGKYGELYENINSAKLYSFFEQYVNERGEIAFNVTLNESERIKKQTSNSAMNDFQKAAAEAIISKDYSIVDKMLKGRLDYSKIELFKQKKEIVKSIFDKNRMILGLENIYRNEKSIEIQMHYLKEIQNTRKQLKQKRFELIEILKKIIPKKK